MSLYRRALSQHKKNWTKTKGWTVNDPKAIQCFILNFSSFFLVSGKDMSKNSGEENPPFRPGFFGLKVLINETRVTMSVSEIWQNTRQFIFEKKSSLLTFSPEPYSLVSAYHWFVPSKTSKKWPTYQQSKRLNVM
jgi:hypothetical protein